MTKLLYLTDSYQKECTAKVIGVTIHEDTILVELDQTIFYPTGGGQPSDSGQIKKQRIGELETICNVISVYKRDGQVFHVVDKEGLAIGDEVTCIIDWEKRYQHMRMHTAAHIISDIFETQEGTLVSGNQLGLDKSRIDLTLEHFDRELMQSFEDNVNAIIKQGLPIQKYFMKREKAEQEPGLFTLLKGFPPHIQEVRVVDIQGLKKSACGGTHLDNTSEIKGVQFTKFENRGAKRRRIYFSLHE
jgi:misacylated tRNA(Ala) deacylase